MTEKTYVVTAFIDAEFEMFRVNEIVNGKPSSDVYYAKNSDELCSYLKKS